MAADIHRLYDIVFNELARQVKFFVNLTLLIEKGIWSTIGSTRLYCVETYIACHPYLRASHRRTAASFWRCRPFARALLAAHAVTFRRVWAALSVVRCSQGCGRRALVLRRRSSLGCASSETVRFGSCYQLVRSLKFARQEIYSFMYYKQVNLRSSGRQPDLFTWMNAHVARS